MNQSSETWMDSQLPHAFDWAAIAVAILVMLFLSPLWWRIGVQVIAKISTMFLIVKDGTVVLVELNGRIIDCFGSNPETDANEYYDLEGKSRPDLAKFRLFAKKPPRHWLVVFIDKLLPGGMRFVGPSTFGYGLRRYDMRWDELWTVEPTKKELGYSGHSSFGEKGHEKHIVAFYRHTSTTSTQDVPQYLGLSKAETKAREVNGEGVGTIGPAVTLRMVVTLRVVNPYLAVVYLRNWPEGVRSLLRPTIREWTANQYIEDVVHKREVVERRLDQIMRHNFNERERIRKEIQADSTLNDEQRREEFKVLDESPSMLDYIEKRYGIRIKRIAVEDIELPEIYATEANERAAAIQKADRIKIEAEAGKVQAIIVEQGRAEAKLIAAKADADSTTMKAKALKEGGAEATLALTLSTLQNVSDNKGLVVLSGEHSQVLLGPLNQQKPAQ